MGLILRDVRERLVGEREREGFGWDLLAFQGVYEDDYKLFQNVYYQTCSIAFAQCCMCCLPHFSSLPSYIFISVTGLTAF